MLVRELRERLFNVTRLGSGQRLYARPRMICEIVAGMASRVTTIPTILDDNDVSAHLHVQLLL